MRKRARKNRRSEEGDQGADRAGAAPRTKAMDRSNPWNYEAVPTRREPGGADVELTADDLKAIHEAIFAIDVKGDRYPASVQALVNR